MPNYVDGLLATVKFAKIYLAGQSFCCMIIAFCLYIATL